MQAPNAHLHRPPATVCMLRMHNISLARNRYFTLIIDSLDIYPDTLYLVQGDNASGKSTLLQLIAGYIRPDVGAIRARCCNGHDNNAGSCLCNIATCFQDDVMFPGLTVGQNIILGAKRFYLARSRTRTIRERADDALKGIEGARWSNRLADTSFGSKSIIRLQRALASEPRCLLLDEATAGLDDARRSVFLESIGATSTPISTIVAATHDSAELLLLKQLAKRREMNISHIRLDSGRVTTDSEHVINA